MWFSGLSVTSEFWLQVIQQTLWVQGEDLDTRGSGSTQPVSVWREGQSVNFVTSRQGVHWDLGSRVPQHNFTVLTGRGNQRTIWGSSDSVDIRVVTDEVSFNLELVQVPGLLQLLHIQYCK